MCMRYVHLTLQSRSHLRSRTHILANVIEINKRSLPNSRLSSFIVLVLSARLTILTDNRTADLLSRWSNSVSDKNELQMLVPGACWVPVSLEMTDIDNHI